MSDPLRTWLNAIRAHHANSPLCPQALQTLEFSHQHSTIHIRCPRPRAVETKDTARYPLSAQHPPSHQQRVQSKNSKKRGPQSLQKKEAESRSNEQRHSGGGPAGTNNIRLLCKRNAATSVKDCIETQTGRQQITRVGREQRPGMTQDAGAVMN